MTYEIFSSVFRREVDGTHILELHKAERKGDPKTTIVMDFCTDVVRVRMILLDSIIKIVSWLDNK